MPWTQEREDEELGRALQAPWHRADPESFTPEPFLCLQLVPWEQDKEDEEPDAPCRRIDIEGANKVVFEDLRLSWDELDFIGIKKVH